MEENFEGDNVNREMDPRQKENQGLDFWAKGLLENHYITQKEYEDFISKNNAKEERMRMRGLPQLKHYGYFTSVDEMRAKVTPGETEKFIIRCMSNKTGDIKRLLDASFDEACEFAETLPGGFNDWKVELKEFVNTKAAGTMIVTPLGKTDIEVWHGPHYLVTTYTPKYRAKFDPDDFDMHFVWTSPENASDLSEMQNYAIKALRHLFPYLKPKSNEPIYAEFGIRDNGEVYFMEANDSVLLAGRLDTKNKYKSLEEERTGD